MNLELAQKIDASLSFCFGDVNSIIMGNGVGLGFMNVGVPRFECDIRNIVCVADEPFECDIIFLMMIMVVAKKIWFCYCLNNRERERLRFEL